MIEPESPVSADHVDTVREEIEFAFDGLEPPDFGEILASFSLNNEDASLIFHELNGRRWTELDATFLAGRWSHFGYLNAVRMVGFANMSHCVKNRLHCICLFM